MSKTKLKKTLDLLSKEQITELVTELYEARPEAREYLDFFIEPDIDSRLSKSKSAIKKELGRTSKGRNRGRITRVRRFIKDISSLNPGAEFVADIMVYAIETACVIGSESMMKETTKRAFGRLVVETVAFADANGLLSSVIPRLESAVKEMKSSIFSRNQFKRILRQSLDEAVENLT